MIKARCSTGYSVTSYFGGFLQKEQVDFDLAAIDADKSFSFILRNDDKMKEGDFAFLQFAMLYNTQFGEKRIRIFNMNLPVTKNLNSYFKAADVEVVAQFMIRKDLCRYPQIGAKAIKELITSNLVTLLHTYRTQCASQSSPSQLILPDSLKLLPLYILSAFKTPVREY